MKVSSCDRLVAKINARFPNDDWFLMSMSNRSGRWCAAAGWGHIRQGDPEEDWAVEVEGSSIRETLIRVLWASR